MPPEDHEMRSQCAVHFERLDGQARKFENGKQATAEAMRELTRTIEAVDNRRANDHHEAMAVIIGYQTEMVKLYSDTKVDLGVNKTKIESAHTRLDSLNKVLTGLTVALILLIIGVAVEAIFGRFV